MRTRNYKSTLIPGVLILSAQLAIASSGGGIDLTINKGCPPGVALCQSQEPPRPVSTAPGWPTDPVKDTQGQAVQPDEIQAKAPLPVTEPQAERLFSRICSKLFQNPPALRVAYTEGSQVLVDRESGELRIGHEALRRLGKLDRPINEALSSLMARALAQHLFETSPRAAEGADPKEVAELTRQIVVELGIPPSAAEQVFDQLSNP